MRDGWNERCRSRGLGMLARASKYWRANLVGIVIDSKEMLSRITTIT